ncbi:MAG TPA: hypothetical protein EYP63_03725 [Desulfotomaculum sp.]|nr:hypothetical protein [Desulfotomaculum sp.]
MPNAPSNLPILILLLIASNKDVDRHLETLTAIAKNTQEAIRSIRQGVQAIHQGLVQAGNGPAKSQPGNDGKPKLL